MALESALKQNGEFSCGVYPLKIDEVNVGDILLVKTKGRSLLTVVF